ncbi:hypothetical protein [Demequina sp. NBRC 110052]|uniref:hypothetical protein n=1 Tax=Demequina sp. NBRC 110052 TaxID=1570341 RepID=UPI000A0333B5|nr:hypothetical protein [Demequina sp. NBRC 110052]
MTNNDYPELFKKYLSSAQSAVSFADPNWTHSAITRERKKRLDDARKVLKDAQFAPDSLVESAANARLEALDSLTPRTTTRSRSRPTRGARLRS